MRSLRRVALLVAPTVLALTLAACGSDDGTTASSTPSTPSTTTSTTVVPTTRVAPGTTAIGQPIPIGQETTAVATTVGGTEGSGTAGSDTTIAGPAATPTTTTAGSTATTSAGAGPTTAAGSTTTSTDDDDSSEPPSPNADTAFCKFEAQIDDAGDAAETDEAFVAALRGLYPQMDQWIANAPTTDLRASATTMRDAAKQAIDANTTDPLYEDDPIEALLRIRLYCGGAG